MTYFQRKPIEGVVDRARSTLPIPGLPSRGPAAGLQPPASARASGTAAAITGIVDQAATVLASERSRSDSERLAKPVLPAGAAAPESQLGQIRKRTHQLVEQLFALAEQGSERETVAPASTISLEGEGPPGDTELIVEPAPVLSPPSSVLPGTTVQIRVPLVNEDQQAAQIQFLSTDLIGQDGACVPAQCVSFQPGELTLQPGRTEDAVVCISVPLHTRSGVYSGLIRASKLDYLHAVLLLQVD